MREMIKMIVVLTLLSSLSGGLLAAVRNGTKERIETQELTFVKGPAIENILKGASNDPVNDRFKIDDNGVERNFFVGIFDGNPNVITFETTSPGFADSIGLMVGINVEEDKIVSVGVTTHKETPGLGAKAAEKDSKFAAQFQGLTVDKLIKVTNDGGDVNAISGATITSRAVCVAATDACSIYSRMKPQIKESLERFKK
jgi:electron transport complex protein RnfG